MCARKTKSDIVNDQRKIEGGISILTSTGARINLNDTHPDEDDLTSYFVTKSYPREQNHF